jgi:hypothetical protein
MWLEGIQIGDIVEVDRLGRRFHALVTGNAPGGLSRQPLDRRISYRSCRAHGTWLFAERNLYVDWTETRPSHP